MTHDDLVNYLGVGVTCPTCVLAGVVGRLNFDAKDIEMFMDLCAECGAIRGAHSPKHPHPRINRCAGFWKGETLDAILASLHEIEESLR